MAETSEKALEEERNNLRGVIAAAEHSLSMLHKTTCGGCYFFDKIGSSLFGVCKAPRPDYAVVAQQGRRVFERQTAIHCEAFR